MTKTGYEDWSDDELAVIEYESFEASSGKTFELERRRKLRLTADDVREQLRKEFLGRLEKLRTEFLGRLEEETTGTRLSSRDVAQISRQISRELATALRERAEAFDKDADSEGEDGDDEG